MKPTLAELVRQYPLPAADRDEELTLPAPFDTVPTSALHRVWVLGRLEAHLAFGYFAWWLRGWTVSADRRTRELAELNVRAALRVLGTMAYLRGAVMKIGQMLALYPDIVPSEFAEVLAALHFQAPPMHWPVVREVLRDELGDDPESVFATIETHPIAAASLGQVHLARLHDGALVCVKVQYPSIARTIDADLNALLALSMPLRLGRSWENLNRQLVEIRDLLTREADYRSEADFLERARALFEPADGITVPRVFREYSTRRVLTMEYLPGPHLDEFLASEPSQAERDRFGNLMYLALFRMYYRGRMCYADPHPGNFVFMADGRLGVIDFGSMRAYTDDDLDLLRLAERSLEGAAGFDEMVRVMIGTDVSSEELALVRGMHDWIVAPIRTETFDFGDPGHLRTGLHWITEAARQRLLRSHPVNVSLGRALFGVRSVLFRTGARVRVRQIHDEEARALTA
jgi:aarF domain-containing kinase